MKTLLSLSLLLLITGCATRRTIMVDTQRDMVLIVKPVKVDGAIWQGGQWVESGKVIIPDGWVAGPERKPKP